MTKAEIVETIYERVGFSKKESAELVETVFDVIKEALVNGEKVKFSGFGNFIVREKNARKGRNPQTGAEIQLEARRVLTFKPSLVAEALAWVGRETGRSIEFATPVAESIANEFSLVGFNAEANLNPARALYIFAEMADLDVQIDDGVIVVRERMPEK